MLDTRDASCDTWMAALLCDGKPPTVLSTRRLSLGIERANWQAARHMVADRKLPPLLRPVKLVTGAARHAGMVGQLRAMRADVVYVWRGLLGRSALGARAARAAGLPCVHFERGPLPGWLQMDFAGVNARSSVPREADFFRRWRAAASAPGAPPLLDWRSLAAELSARAPRRKLVAQTARTDWTGEGNFLFCPFQLNAAGDPLPDGGWVSDPADLVTALWKASRALPDGWHLRVKPHPNAPGDLSQLIAPHLDDRLRLDRDTNSLDQLAASRGVVTVNSAMGLEAFFHDKPVIVLGDSYYGGLGRTDTAGSDAALAALLAAPERLHFDTTARDDLMAFLFNDFFVRQEDVASGRFDLASLTSRAARLAAL